MRPPTRNNKPYVKSSDGENNDWNWDGIPKFYKDISLYLSSSDDDDDDDVDVVVDDDDDGGNSTWTYSTAVFKVYRLLHLSNKWEKIKSIGEYMLIFG